MTQPDESTSDGQRRQGAAPAQFFTNAVNTTNRGIDVVVDFVKKFQDKRQLRVLLAGNIQNMSIDDINVPLTLDDTDAHRANLQRPRTGIPAGFRAKPQSLLVTRIHQRSPDHWHAPPLLRQVRLLGYGEDGSGIAPAVPLDNGNGYVSDEYIYRPKVSTDFYAGYKIGKHLAT